MRDSRVIMPSGLRRWWRDRFGVEKFWVITGLVVVFVIVPAVWFFGFRTVAHDAQISGRSWERRIEIEQYRTIEGRAWEGSEPSDARIYDRRTEQSGAITVSCGKNCTMTIPTYDTRVYYHVDRWKTESWVVAEGTEIAPYWPALPAGLDPANVVGNRRQGDEQRDWYKLDVACLDGDCRNEIKVDQALWSDCPPGREVTADVTVLGTIRGIKKETP